MWIVGTSLMGTVGVARGGGEVGNFTQVLK